MILSTLPSHTHACERAHTHTHIQLTHNGLAHQSPSTLHGSDQPRCHAMKVNPKPSVCKLKFLIHIANYSVFALFFYFVFFLVINYSF